ncbi:uncharacterized protein LOC116260129 [Nymphaea colorata]|nr:uncharacterized protein LOC116260129 [Nymphaea colorata]
MKSQTSIGPCLSHSSSSMEISKWIVDLPSMEGWSGPAASSKTFELMGSHDDQGKSLILRAERTSGSKQEALVTFSLGLSAPADESTTLWVSNPFSISGNVMEETVVPLLVQLLEEIINRAPNNSSVPLFKLTTDLSDTFLSYPAESLYHFLDFVFTCRFFWLCLCNAPSEIGSLFFQKFSSKLVASSCKQILKAFLTSIGADFELKFTRSLSYIYTKLLILRSFDVKSKEPNLGIYSSSYASASHDFLVFKGYVPLLAMNQEWTNENKQGLLLDTAESVLRYTLAHQQLEAVAQFEYSVHRTENYLKVDFKVDNIRINVSQLRFNGSELLCDEKHFPSRVCITLGPELGSSYVVSTSLGRSTPNHEKEIKAQKTIKGNFVKTKLPILKTTARTATRRRVKSWTVDQAAEGDTATLDMILCDNSSGVEVAAWRPGANTQVDLRNSFRKRYAGANRALGKAGGVVFAGDEYGEQVSWRLKKEAEGRELQWKVGFRVWLTYIPNDCKTSYLETRCVQWEEEFSFTV